MPNTVNILLTHYPHFFDYPELGIDLTLAGDIHGGGQLSLDLVHRGLNLGGLLGVPYVRGWYEKQGAQAPYEPRHRNDRLSHSDRRKTGDYAFRADSIKRIE